MSDPSTPKSVPPALGARVLTVTSGKGGVGKTFLSANLAAALARRGQRVLVSGLRVLVDEHAGGGQVPRDPGGELLGQALQLAGDRPVELLAGDVLGQRRSVVVLQSHATPEAAARLLRAFGAAHVPA